MGNDIQKGTVYAEGGIGGVGTVNAANLNAHVDEAVIKASFISGKTLKDPAALDDSVLVENSGVFYRETMQQIMDLIANSVKIPTGIIMDYAGTSLPEGWLFCYGQLVSRATYDLLFGCIGTTYGVGDGTTTFAIPDLRGRVSAGQDDMGGPSADRLVTQLNGDTLGATGGDEEVTLTQAQMPAHQHYFTGGTFGANHIAISGYYITGGSGPIGSTGGTGFTPNVPITFGGTVQTPVSGPTDSRGSGTVHTNLQPTIVINKIIRYL